jgi:hypothetical protein
VIVSGTLARDLRVYAEMTKKLPLFTEWDDALNVLVWRSAIYDEVMAGESLSGEELRELRAADDRLVAQRDYLMAKFPGVFESKRSVDRREWWWYLDEGPRVREEAERAA